MEKDNKMGKREMTYLCGNDEEFEYMGMPYFASDGTLYNVCDCGSYKLLTKPVIENGYRCEKCGKNWKTKSVASTFK